MNFFKVGDKVYTKDLLRGVITNIRGSVASVDLDPDCGSKTIEIGLHHLVHNTGTLTYDDCQSEHLIGVLGNILYMDNDQFKRSNRDKLADMAAKIIASGWRKAPCNVGDAVYWVVDKTEEHDACIYTGIVNAISYDSDKKFWAHVKYENGLSYYHDNPYFGRELFLNKKIAEEELRRRKSED